MSNTISADNGGRRSGTERRQILLSNVTPEKRAGIERRNGGDRRSERYRNRSDLKARG